MRRRDFISLAGSAVAAWPLVAHAQRSATPVVGFLRSTTPEPFQHIVTAFREGLNEAGFVEGQNVTVEYRWANNRLDHLPGLAADLVRRQVAVIVGNSLAVEAAKAVTSTTPIVFVTADDPVKSGFVNSLGRPGGNLTGVTFFGGGRLGAKRAELLHELVPTTAAMAVLLDPNYPGFQAELPDVQATIRALGRKAVVVEAANGREFDAAFARTVDAGADALLVGGSPVFTGRRRELVELAARHAVPAIYDQRDYVAAGGLISYGASFTGAYRQAGIYAGRILKGAKPSELPVLQPTTFELVVNLKTAKALGLDVPPSITLRADEVIE
jgi:putative tryptophan/tyrosine transport system substrate-binding protein